MAQQKSDTNEFKFKDVLEMIKRWKRADILVEESNRSDIKEEELR